MKKDGDTFSPKEGESVALVAEKPKGIKKALSSCFEEVSALQENAAKKIEDFITEEVDDVDSMMSVMDEADKTFDMMMDISERLSGSYDTFMKGL
ncbi:MAG: hypothetical protein HN411_01360 [Waddliaceae bacterium]|mgnify:CR=1 FL=1|jgi:flagellar hook-basal body complex protein FliE|nr:hypothetical protein [Waddliaceae bacterium]MBT3579367.1 hypothetical protein [Waddliaceae bacterium]MBT4444857.1 hypothetical protein [Waddliaceae bacterium]MBT6928007.1 hypothetical protein [Waddliaceae bacterium]MBT7264317.1 hypothetical protein [Waddliaceae bacterium]